MLVILNVLILSEYKTQNRGEKSKWYKRSRFLRAHVCSYKSSVYDVLYSKGKCFGCVFMKYLKEVKQQKVGRFKIIIESDDKVKALSVLDLKDQDYIKVT
jgi:hypothetical protein